jgi:raffinose/stachyose/melibiose transport system substrate-binding protein
MVVVASLIGGCGSSSKKDDTSKKDADNSGKTSFEFSMHVANVKEQEPAVYAVVQEYMKQNPDVEIKLTGEETNEHYNKMKMDAQAGTLPDVFFNLLAPSKEMAAKGDLYNLDDFIKENNLSDIMNDNMLNSMKVDGSVYGLPYQKLVTGFWYNQALFDKYNLKVPETYDELLDAAKVFKENGIATIANGAQDPYSVWGTMGLLCRFGYFDKIDDILAGKEKYDNPDYLKFYEKLDELRNTGAFSDNVSTSTYYDAKEMFMSGKAAMFDSGTWESAYLEGSEYKDDINFSWGVSFDDGIGDQNVSMQVPHAPLCISAKVADDPDKEAAVLDFFKFYYSDEGAKIMIDNLCTPPTNYTEEPSEEFLSEHPVFGKVLDAMKQDTVSPVMQPDNVSTEAFGNAMYDSIYGVINGVYSPKEACDMVDDEIQLAQ